MKPNEFMLRELDVDELELLQLYVPYWFRKIITSDSWFKITVPNYTDKVNLDLNIGSHCIIGEYENFDRIVKEDVNAARKSILSLQFMNVINDLSAKENKWLEEHELQTNALKLHFQEFCRMVREEEGT